MRAGLFVVLAAIAIAEPAAASTWKLLHADRGELVFIDEDAPVPVGMIRSRSVLRSFETEQSLGGVYPHRSETLRYLIDCQSSRLAMTAWEFRGGTLGHGPVVWADSMEDVTFSRPASKDMVVVGAACAAR